MSLDPKHDRFEAEVNTWLRTQGFATSELTYHNNLDRVIKNILQSSYTPTSLYIRTRADRFAVKERPSVCFEYEVKTRFHEGRCDFLIEFLPLLAHYLVSQLKACCLYICRLNNIEKGFWADNLAIVDDVMIPNRFWNYNNGYFIHLVTHFLGKEPIHCTSRGSGDPFAVIGRDIFESFDDWKDIILNLHITGEGATA